MAGIKLQDQRIPSEVAEKLLYYVYVLVDPGDESIFYVGKGVGQRLTQHTRSGAFEDILNEDKEKETAKDARINEIRARKSLHNEPRIDVVCHRLLREEDAFLVEAALIDCLPKLTNKNRGHGGSPVQVPSDIFKLPPNIGGRIQRRDTLQNLISLYGAPDLSNEIDPAVLIRLSSWKEVSGYDAQIPGGQRSGVGYYDRMPDSDLLDATRGWWRISEKRIEKEKITHAVAVYEGITRAVMRIGRWEQRCYTTSGGKQVTRRAFTATIEKSGSLFEQYIGESGNRVKAFERGGRNPIYYWLPKA